MHQHSNYKNEIMLTSVIQKELISCTNFLSQHKINAGKSEFRYEEESLSLTPKEAFNLLVKRGNKLMLS